MSSLLFVVDFVAEMIKCKTDGGFDVTDCRLRPIRDKCKVRRERQGQYGRGRGGEALGLE